ncbi:hypothetical protein EVAR_10735_1 [Eumeta japonica]|uniref:SWIM-type domain-containing protein n=1 Tax=Eumeta variegata TaxID=151549 RepID=A0A4C1W5Z4_EUMVA|nr:hypothetical protein EVAR_10735_1 [Eumeta japonica]
MATRLLHSLRLEKVLSTVGAVKDYDSPYDAFIDIFDDDIMRKLSLKLTVTLIKSSRPSYGDDAEEAVKSIECHDCVASQGGCKHAIAFLMWIHRRSEEPSCTSVECYWMKSKLSRAGSTLKYLTASEMSNAKPIAIKYRSI